MNLSMLSMFAGAGFLCLGLLGLIRPDRLISLAVSFPRSAWPGRLMVAVALPWAAYFQLITPPVAGHAMLTKLVIWSVPVAFVLILIYLKELLSVRALGGLFLLSATPLLKYARLHESPFSILVTLVTYVLIIVGIIWVLSPFRFRHWFERCSVSSARLQHVMLGFSGLGATLVVLGLFVY